ncbi:hypothetical protein MCOR08_003786 [Pyricularia oryzae]|nr:hypothetical protein MCOR08_003786 [Pyricularia oryzae]
MHFTSNMGVGAILLSAVAVSAWPIDGASPNRLTARGVGVDAGNIPIEVNGVLTTREVPGAKNPKPAAGPAPPASAAGKKTTASPPGAAAAVPPPKPPVADKGKGAKPPTGGLTTPQGLPVPQGADKGGKAPGAPAQSTTNTNKPAVGSTGTTSPAPNPACAPGANKKKGKLGRRADNNPWCTNPNQWGSSNAASGSGGYNAGGSGANIWGSSTGGGSSANIWGSSTGGGGGGGGNPNWGGGGAAAAGSSDGGFSAIGGQEIAMQQFGGPFPGQTYKTKGLVNCFGVAVLTNAAQFATRAPALAHVTADMAGMQTLAAFVQQVAQSGYPTTRIVIRQASTSSGMVPNWTPTDTSNILSLRSHVVSVLSTLGVQPQAVSSSMGGELYRNRQPPAGTMWVNAQGQIYVDGNLIHCHVILDAVHDTVQDY